MMQESGVKAVRGAAGFTLIEIMVTAGLMSLVFGSVFSVLMLVEKIFERESREMLVEFDVYNYSMRLERLLGGADMVRELQGHAGLWAISIDHDRRQARETVHLVVGERLYMIEKEYAWSEPPVFRQGEVFFASTELRLRMVKHLDLKGVDLFQTRMVYPDDDSGALFSSFELKVVRTDTNKPVFLKRYAAGGHQELDSREPYIFLEQLPEIPGEEDVS